MMFDWPALGNSQLALHEEFFLLSLEGERGTFSGAIDHGLAGAIVSELELEGRLVFADRRVAAVNRTATGKPILDGVLDAVVETMPSTMVPILAADLIADLTLRPLRMRVQEQLMQRGLIVQRERPILGRFGVSRLRVEPLRLRTFLLARLHRSALEGQAISERDGRLVAMLAASRGLSSLLPSALRERGLRSAEQLVQRDLAARAVQRALAEFEEQVWSMPVGA